MQRCCLCKPRWSLYEWVCAVELEDLAKMKGIKRRQKRAKRLGLREVKRRPANCRMDWGRTSDGRRHPLQGFWNQVVKSTTFSKKKGANFTMCQTRKVIEKLTPCVARSETAVQVCGSPLGWPEATGSSGPKTEIEIGASGLAQESGRVCPVLRHALRSLGQRDVRNEGSHVGGLDQDVSKLAKRRRALGQSGSPRILFERANFKAVVCFTNTNKLCGQEIRVSVMLLLRRR